MTPRLPFSFFVYLSPPSLLFHYSHWFLPFRTAPLCLFFSSLSQNVSTTLSSTTLLSFLRLSPSLVQRRGNLRYLSADVKPCTAPLCTPLCWDADKRHCLATLPQACIFQINRCSLTHKHMQAHAHSCTYARTHTLTRIHTHTHSNPLQVYRSFIDALLQSAQLLQNFSTAKHRSYLQHLYFALDVLKQSISVCSFHLQCNKVGVVSTVAILDSRRQIASDSERRSFKRYRTWVSWTDICLIFQLVCSACAGRAELGAAYTDLPVKKTKSCKVDKIAQKLGLSLHTQWI